jgi:hypothetical protein
MQEEAMKRKVQIASGTSNLKSWKNRKKKTDSNEAPNECAAGRTRWDKKQFRTDERWLWHERGLLSGEETLWQPGIRVVEVNVH